MEPKYKFVWEDTRGADLSLPRPALEPAMRVETRRLFQLTLRDILGRHYRTETAALSGRTLS